MSFNKIRVLNVKNVIGGDESVADSAAESTPAIEIAEREFEANSAAESQSEIKGDKQDEFAADSGAGSSSFHIFAR